ncbi:MAG: HNH endonuclease [Armatimonadetes bacterium]|nr:HNH endonuclease [Armatimonadota bacterium]
MKPFDDYPGEGKELLGKLRKNWNCRHGYGVDLLRRTGHRRCAYCGVNLVDDYHHWLLLCVDHVVPIAEAKKLSVPDDFITDMINLVICCIGCNGFGNRFDFSTVKAHEKWTVKEFVKLRDRVFAQRMVGIGERRAEEMSYFDSKPWEPAGYPRVVTFDRTFYPEDLPPGLNCVDFNPRRYQPLEAVARTRVG